MNLHQHTKNQAISSIFHWDVVGLKILKSRTRFFIDGIRQIISTPIKDQMHWYLKTKFFNNLKKPHLDLFWDNFGTNKFKNLAVTLNFMLLVNTISKFWKKHMIWFHEKHLDRQMGRRMGKKTNGLNQV